MKLTKLAIGECCNHITIVKGTVDTSEDDDARYLTREELKRVVEVYNAVALSAEGSNNLPYQLTFPLLKEDDIAEPVA